MPKCGECGAFLEDGGLICPICGTTVTAGAAERTLPNQPREARLVEEWLTSPGKNASPAPATPAPSSLADETKLGRAGTAADSQVLEFATQLEVGSASETDSSGHAPGATVERGDGENPGHLGKGLIKPQVVAVEQDGYHFRYDEPKLNFLKVDNAQDKVVEFRVSSEDMERLKEAKAPEAAPPAEPVSLGAAENDAELSAAPAVQAGTWVSEEFGEQITEPANPEQEPADADPAELGKELLADEIRETEAELISESIDLSAADPESLPDTELPEPELVVEVEPETIWTGVRTHLGFSSKDSYRLTNREIRSLGAYGQTLGAVDLATVTAVRLEQPLLGRLFGVGDVLVFARNEVKPALIVKSVKEPDRVRRLLEKFIRRH